MAEFLIKQNVNYEGILRKGVCIFEPTVMVVPQHIKVELLKDFIIRKAQTQLNLQKD